MSDRESTAPIDEGSVEVDIRGGVAVVTLQRPERLNALTGTMLAALSAAYGRCDLDDDVRVVVLTGAGAAFSAGADLSAGRGTFDPVADPAAFRSSPVRPAAFEVRKPVIAAVNGHAVGLGFTLALQCDLRIMAEEAKWGVVQARRGAVGDAHSHWTLVRSVGTARAAEILLTGRMFTGADALALGVGNWVVPAADVLPIALDLAAEMAERVNPLSAALSKQILWAATTAGADEVDDLERRAHVALFAQPDAHEGAAAFVEKRSPRWSSAVPADWPADWPG
jgi:enoyl-CoA hydratase/carnithine racemase